MHYHLIINPNAGNKEQSLVIKRVKQKCANRKVKLTISQTKAQNDAIKLAKKSKADVIIAAGGDGTINEVINGIVQSNKDHPQQLALLPIGTANMLAKYFGVPTKSDDAIDLIFTGTPQTIDIGKANDRCFILAVGVGYDAEFYSNVQPIFKKAFGTAAYPISAWKTLFEHEPREMTLRTKELEISGYHIVICNIGQYGKAFNIAPQAKVDDGLLDVLVFQKKDAHNIIKYAVGVVGKYHNLFKDVRRLQSRKFTIECDHPMLAHADAEIIGTTPLKVEVLTNKVSIISAEKQPLIDEKVITGIKSHATAFVKDKMEKIPSPIESGKKILKKIKKAPVLKKK